MTRGHYIRSKVRRNNYHLAFKKGFRLEVSWFAVGPSRFQFFSFSVLMPVCSLKFTFSNCYVREIKQGMFSLHIRTDSTRNAVDSIFSIMCVQKFTITFSSLCLHFVRVLCLVRLAVRTQRKLAALLWIAALTSSTFMVC